MMDKTLADEVADLVAERDELRRQLKHMNDILWKAEAVLEAEMRPFAISFEARVEPAPDPCFTVIWPPIRVMVDRVFAAAHPRNILLQQAADRITNEFRYRLLRLFDEDRRGDVKNA